MSVPSITSGAALLEAEGASAVGADDPLDDGLDDLMRGLRAGQPAAVARAYDLHHVAIRGFARRLVGDLEVAEDLVQDVFLALPRAIRRFQGGSALRTFLIGIAINHARHHVRAAARRRRALSRLAEDRRPGPDSPDETAERHRLAARLLLALDELPLRQRLAFLLCEVEERSSAEAATILGIPDATVRTRLHHARARLRAALTTEESP